MSQTAARTATRKKAWLEQFEALGSVTLASEAIGVPRQMPYDWKKSDPAFLAAYEEAERVRNEQLEVEARRRAVEGVLEPVYQGGKMIGGVRKYSDTLLMFLLNGAMPEKYKRDRVNQQVVVDNRTQTLAITYEDRRALPAPAEEQEKE